MYPQLCLVGYDGWARGQQVIYFRLTLVCIAQIKGLIIDYHTHSCAIAIPSNSFIIDNPNVSYSMQLVWESHTFVWLTMCLRVPQQNLILRPCFPMQSIREGDCVIIYETLSKMNQIIIRKGASFQNGFGHFYHDDFIGKPFGTKVESWFRVFLVWHLWFLSGFCTRKVQFWFCFCTETKSRALRNLSKT